MAEEIQIGEIPQARPAPLKLGPKQFVWGTGRRKKSIARVRIRPGSGKFMVNDRDANEYFVFEAHRQAIVAPLTTANVSGNWDVYVSVDGGGMTGQSGAVALGLARALRTALPEVEASLRSQGLLTRDARAKERKKYGQKGARRRFQFSKR